MFEKLTKWLIFTVSLALFPLVISSLFHLIHTKQFSLEGLLERGELFLITAVICGSSMGELFGTGPCYKVIKIIAGGASMLILLLSAICFADVSAANLINSANIDKSLVCKASIVIFIGSLITSTCCIILSEA